MDAERESDIRKMVSMEFDLGFATARLLLDALDDARRERDELIKRDVLADMYVDLRNYSKQVIEERDTLRRERDALKDALKCKNPTCPAPHAHSNVWCDWVIQRDLGDLKRERDEAIEAAERGLELLASGVLSGETVLKARDALEKLKAVRR